MDKQKHKNIFLVGPMGAGKSSVGKYLAQLMNMDFYDTDEEIEKRTGVEIGWVIDLEGEEGFKRRETAVIKEIATLPNIILATGGGSVLTSENRQLLKANGVVIYLEVSLDYQHHRTINESRRPILRVKNRREVLEQIYHERNLFYEEIADYKVSTNHRSIKEVSEEIASLIK